MVIYAYRLRNNIQIDVKYMLALPSVDVTNVIAQCLFEFVVHTPQMDTRMFPNFYYYSYFYVLVN